MLTRYTYDSLTIRLASYDGCNPTYDADGNMLNAQLDGFLCNMTYDYMNRLVSARNNTYTYNAENMRIRNVCDMYETEYTYDPNGKLNKLIMKNTTGSVKKYVYGLGLIGEDDNGHFKTYHFDYRGSTVAITNESGAITDRFAYDTYGKQISHTGNSFIIFGYNGRDGVITDVNGLLYMRSRYYSPELRRFVNADVLHGNISNSSSLNRYAYVNGNPVSFVDPFGLAGEESWTSKIARWFVNEFVPIRTYSEQYYENGTVKVSTGLTIPRTAFCMALSGIRNFAAVALPAVTAVGGIALATLPAAVVTGGVAGGLVGGVASAANGNSFWGGFLAGGLIGTLFSLGNSIGVATAPMMPLISTAAFGLTAMVAIGEIEMIRESKYMVKNYTGKFTETELKQFETEDGGLIFNTDDERMKYVNYLYDLYINSEEDNTEKHWSKEELYREVKYHNVGAKLVGEDGPFYGNLKKPDVEEKQIFRTYILRFAGNLISYYFG